MAEILSPGIFIEEVPSNAVTVQPVSTSTMGIIGATERGPTDEATLVTSWEQYVRIFGQQIPESRTHLAMASFFANGGRRAYVVRVMPADAVAADADIQSQRYDEKLAEGDGTTATTTQATTGAVPMGDGIVPGSLTLKWRSNAAAAVTLGVLRNRANGADVSVTDGDVLYEARVNPSAIPAVEPGQPAIAPDATLTLAYDKNGGGDETITLTPPVGASLISTTTTAQGSVIVLDLVTGYLSAEFAGTDVPATGATSTLRLTFTPTTATRTATDDGAGGLTGTGVSAAVITYASGNWSLTTAATYHLGDGCPLLATYKAHAWDIEPISVGSWANDMKLEIRGNDDYYTAATNSFSRFNLSVLILNSESGSYDVVETFEELSFTDDEDAQYFPDVINDLSDLITVGTTPVNAEAPGALNGRAGTLVLAGGDEAGGNRAVTGTLAVLPIAPRSVVITYKNTAGTVLTITDDGEGLLTGDIDDSVTATVNYTNGAVAFSTDVAIGGGSLVEASWRAVATSTAHTEIFGSATSRYTDAAAEVHYAGGDDGTFDTTQWGRSQFSSSAALSADYKGIYALNRVDELMQVVLPDYAGDTTITKDLLDYAESRRSQPSGGDRFIILTTPSGRTATQAVDFVRYSLNQYSKYAAIYWPWVKVADPLKNNREVVFPPLGHIAGIYARTDTQRNVGKAPGGTVDGALRFITQLESVPTQGERDLVYPNKINPLISSPQTGLAVWGVRTLSQDSEWRYINASRLFMFAEKAVFNSTHWIVFENNGPALWLRIKSQIQGFLNGLYNDGMLAGNSPSQAFYVRVDEGNNTEDSIAAGQVVIDVGLAPNKPGEFVRFRFSQKSLNS